MDPHAELEQPKKQTPTEASKRFLTRWEKQVVIASGITSVGFGGYFMGINAAEGRFGLALVGGLVTAICGFATGRVSMVNTMKK